MRRRFLIVHNPGAGSRRKWRLHAVIEGLQRQGCSIDLQRAESSADNRRIVREALEVGAVDAVVAAGGDGTVRAAATVLMGSTMPLGIIPIGTGNVMAHEIGLRLDPRSIMSCLTRGPTTPVRPAFANGEPFFLMVGAGFDGRVTRLLDAAFKQRVGKLAYTWPVICGVLAGPDHLRVRVDDQEHAAAWTVATIGRRYAGAFMLAPQAHLAASSIQTVLFHAQSRVSMLSQLVEVAAGRIERRSDIEHVPGTIIEITSDRPVPVQVDGEPFGSTPVRISAGGPALELIVPPASGPVERVGSPPVRQGALRP